MGKMFEQVTPNEVIQNGINWVQYLYPTKKEAVQAFTIRMGHKPQYADTIMHIQWPASGKKVWHYRLHK